MLVTLFTVCYFAFAVYAFAPVLAKAWHTGIWPARGTEWSRTTQPKRYWFGMSFGAFNILLPTFILWVLIFYGPR
ncbi:hypothetical protein [Phyllobacterium sp. P5_D12]